jgi:hypothetical protein
VLIDARQEFSADTAAARISRNRHRTKLDRVIVILQWPRGGDRHAADDAITIAMRHGDEVMRRRVVVQRKDCRLAREAGTKDFEAQIDDFFRRGGANGEVG